MHHHCQERAESEFDMRVIPDLAGQGRLAKPCGNLPGASVSRGRRRTGQGICYVNGQGDTLAQRLLGIHALHLHGRAVTTILTLRCSLVSTRQYRLRHGSVAAASIPSTGAVYAKGTKITCPTTRLLARKNGPAVGRRVHGLPAATCRCRRVSSQAQRGEPFAIPQPRFC